jgi:soluble cytochrome b562
MLYRRVNIINYIATFFMKGNITRLISFYQLKNKDFIITTELFEEILRQIKEEMAKVLKSTENAATKEEYDDLKKKLIDLEAKLSDEKKGKLENEKELAELKKTISALKKKLLELDAKMSIEKDEKLENAELKKKLGVLETLVSEQKKVKQISFCLLTK